MTLLEKIRNKSDSEKRTFSFVTAFLITIVIFGIWLFSTMHTLSFNIPNINEENQSASPIESIGNSLKNVVGGSKNIYKSPEN